MVVSLPFRELFLLYLSGILQLFQRSSLSWVNTYSSQRYDNLYLHFNVMSLLLYLATALNIS